MWLIFKKWSIFNLWVGDGILMKFDVWNDIVSELLFWIPTGSDDIGGVGGGKPKILENT